VSQLDLFSGRDLRDDGIARVTSNAGKWTDRAFSAVCTLPPGWTGLGEDVRAYVLKVVGPPHHHNAWGGLVMKAMRRAVLADTGERAASKSLRSHAR
jgi:hypothetical protein